MAEADPNQFHWIRGYKFKPVQTYPETYECPICFELIRNCVVLPCCSGEHICCENCLDGWQRKVLERNKEDKFELIKPKQKIEEGKNDDNPISDDESKKDAARLTCPMCREPYDKEQVKKVPVVDKFMSKLEVYCLHSNSDDDGCPWTGPISQIEKHRENECNYKIIKCRLGCDVSFPRKDQEKHEEKCEFRKVGCKHCKEKFRANEIKEHHKKCDSKEVVCNNDGCDVKLPRKEMLSSHAKNCPEKIIDCDYAQHGCEWKKKKKEQVQHNKDSDSEHTKLLLGSLTQEMKEMRVNKVDKLYLEKANENLEEQKNIIEEQKNIIEKFISLMQQSKEKRLQFSEATTPKDMFLQLVEEEKEIDPQLLEPFTYEEYDFGKEFRFLELNYEERMKLLLSKMAIGGLYHIEQGRKLIFKLLLENQTHLYVQHYSSIPSYHSSYRSMASYRNPSDLIFGNSYFAIFYSNSNTQYLAFNIHPFTQSNAVMYLHSVKKKGGRQELIYYGNVNTGIDWNEYKTADGFLLFELAMK